MIFWGALNLDLFSIFLSLPPINCILSGPIFCAPPIFDTGIQGLYLAFVVLLLREQSSVLSTILMWRLHFASILRPKSKPNSRTGQQLRQQKWNQSLECTLFGWMPPVSRKQKTRLNLSIPPKKCRKDNFVGKPRKNRGEIAGNLASSHNTFYRPRLHLGSSKDESKNVGRVVVKSGIFYALKIWAYNQLW